MGCVDTVGCATLVIIYESLLYCTVLPTCTSLVFIRAEEGPNTQVKKPVRRRPYRSLVVRDVNMASLLRPCTCTCVLPPLGAQAASVSIMPCASLSMGAAWPPPQRAYSSRIAGCTKASNSAVDAFEALPPLVAAQQSSRP